jgi:deoxyribodipyrimidine photo-lyase
MIHEERIRKLNKKEMRRGAYVLYWMQASQRADWNHALEYAVRAGNERSEPVLAVFGLTSHFPEANRRHYAFMLQGLRDASRALEAMGICLAVVSGDPDRAAVRLGRRASLVVADRGYLRIQKAWREKAATELPCALIEVETDAIVPVETASCKEEYSAKTLRSKIHRVLDHFLVPLRMTKPKRDSLGLAIEGIDLSDPDAALSRLGIEADVRPVTAFRGGAAKAEELLATFIEEKLARYHESSRDPAQECISYLSPYLHFGQISPLKIALEVRSAARCPNPARQAVLEQLIVRRELSLNFVRFNPHYDTYEALPAWARRTLEEHGGDRKEIVYTLRELETASTHDRYWNAAMKEMIFGGTMHNTMRMYWGKKILEWSPGPEEAFRRALFLNNKYFLDGRDPNSFAGVAWCFGKHDQAWAERKIFGKVRYMNAAGLERKYEIEEYVSRIKKLESAVRERESKK